MIKIFKTFIPLISIWFLTINLKGLNLNSEVSYLVLDGKISYEDKEGSVCKINLYCNNILLDSVILNNGKNKFKFNLNRNEYYTIRITKNNFIDRIVCINTDVPNKEINRISSHKFKFYTKLMKKDFSNKMNKDILDFPIAIIAYNNKKERFTYYKKYTNRIKKELSTTKSS